MADNDHRATRMGSESIPKLLFKFSVPAIIGMAVNALYNIIDRIFLGQVSNDAIAGVYVTFPITLIIMAVGMLFGTGGNALVSLRLGQDRKKDAEEILSVIFSLLLISSLLLGILMYLFLPELLSFFGASLKLLPFAQTYMHIILLGLPFMLISFGLNNFMRGEGNPMMAMISMLLGAIANIFLDYVFIVIMHMGVAGAAWATIIGQGLSFLCVMWHFISKNSKSVLKIHASDMKIKWSVSKEAMELGFPFFGMQIAASLVAILFNHKLHYLGGDLAIATMGIIQSISTAYLFPIFGINQGSQPILGYNYAAGKFARVKKTTRLAIVAGITYLTIFCFLLYFFTDNVIGIFVSNPEEYEKIYEMAHKAIRLAFWSIPIVSYPVFGGIYFLAVGKAMISSILSMARQFLILVPVVLLMSRFFGLSGVWLSYPLSDVLTALLTFYYLEREMKSLNLKIAEEEAQKV